MKSIDDIKYICCDRFTTTNDIIAKTIYCKHVDGSIPQIMACHYLFILKERTYGTSTQEDIFEDLEDSKYNNNYEIISLINSLNRAKGKEKEQVINRYLNSPYIDNIKQDRDSYLVESSSLGNYKIDSMDSYLRVKPAFLNRLISGCCYTNAKYVLAYNPNFYAVTSFISTIFGKGSCYHAYCLDKKNNKVVDPTYKIVMDKEEYDKLFQTEEIFRVTGNNLGDAFNIALRHKIELKMYEHQIGVTLFQQYIWENELPSPNSSIYSSVPDNKHLLVKHR